jgi:hypothetical protein
LAGEIWEIFGVIESRGEGCGGVVVGMGGGGLHACVKYFLCYLEKTAFGDVEKLSGGGVAKWLCRNVLFEFSWLK